MNDELDLARLPRSLEITGLGRSTFYGNIRVDLMTPGVEIGPGSRGWPVGELRQINQARIRGDSEEEIRALVRRLREARKVPT